MTTSKYPTVVTSGTEEQVFRSVLDFCLEISRLRENEDIGDFTNLRNIFVNGRSTTRVPSSNNDVIPTDNLGDIVNDGTFEYKLINTGAGLRWDRRTLDTNW